MLVSELGPIEGYADPVCWKVKPSKPEIGAISNRITSHRKSWTVDEWAYALERGQTVLPSILSTTCRAGDNVESQQIFPIDFDHGTSALSPSMTVNVYRDRGITPAIVYHSMRSDLYAPRYRVVVVTATPAMGAEQISRVYSALLDIARPAPDPTSGDLARMFFGASSTFPLPVRRLWEHDGGDGEAPTIEQIAALAPAFEPDRAFRGRGDGRKRRNKADEYLLSHVDLLAFARELTGEAGVRRGQHVTFHKCPVCGHFDHFVVTPNPDGVDTWTCYGSHGVYADAKGKPKHPGGTIVDLVAWIRKGGGNGGR